MIDETGIDGGIGVEDGKEIGAHVEDDWGDKNVGAFVDPGQAQAYAEGVDALVEVAVVDGEGEAGEERGRPEGELVPKSAEHQRAEDEFFAEGIDKGRPQELLPQNSAVESGRDFLVA